MNIFTDNVLIGNFFVNVRNIFYCTLIFAAGSYANNHQPDFVLGTFWEQYWGYPLIFIGTLLFLVNLIHYTIRIFKLKNHWSTNFFIVLIHVTLSVRVAMLVLYFRMKF